MQDTAIPATVYAVVPEKGTSLVIEVRPASRPSSRLMVYDAFY